MNAVVKNDPTFNVKDMFVITTQHQKELREAETSRVNERIEGEKSAAGQRFDAQQLALNDALRSQEKQTASAYEGTKEAINKADTNTDKRFSLLSEKIDGITMTMNKSTGERGIYVTHSDLSIEMEKLRTSIETTLRPVVAFMNSQVGTGTGYEKMYGWIATGIVVLISIAVFISQHFK